MIFVFLGVCFGFGCSIEIPRGFKYFLSVIVFMVSLGLELMSISTFIDNSMSGLMIVMSFTGLIGKCFLTISSYAFLRHVLQCQWQNNAILEAFYHQEVICLKVGGRSITSGESVCEHVGLIVVVFLGSNWLENFLRCIVLVNRNDEVVEALP